MLSVVDDHVLRVAGRAQWLRDSPRYVVEPDDRLVARGTWANPSGFVGSLIVGSRLFALAWKALEVDEAGERRLFVRILREIEAKLAADYGARLVVLYYSGETWRGDLAGWRDKMVPVLCKANVAVLDVNALLADPSQPIDRFYMRDDGHPTALLNQTIAGALDEAGHDESAAAIAAARKQVSRLRGLEPDVARRRLAGHLARRGFAWPAVSVALAVALPGAGVDEEILDPADAEPDVDVDVDELP